jgi:UDP-N-acetylmuramyl pentapeptide phosphotransferase/UDP-N-acetylglucosamine-1-phosphate transferase
MTFAYLVILFISAFLFSIIGTVFLVYLLPKLKLMDAPIERSNHSVPVPRGGGIAVIFAACGFLLVAGAAHQVVLATLFLACVSFFDDLKGLSARTRLIAQALAVFYGISHMPEFTLSGGIVPHVLELALLGIVWIWFINLYNFMDGIDGITVMQTISIALGIFALGMVHSHVSMGMMGDSTIIIAAALGFGLFNWHPARIFLGDVGSVALGYLMGYMLLLLVAKGHWEAALILPAYYLFDATFTLTRRLATGKNILQGHSEHYYQQAVRSGAPHDLVVRQIALLNVGLILLAAASTLNHTVGIAALAIAYLLAFLLTRQFRSGQVQIMPPSVAHKNAKPARDNTRLIPDIS